jgi:hypothetical protein
MFFRRAGVQIPHDRKRQFYIIVNQQIENHKNKLSPYPQRT